MYILGNNVILNHAGKVYIFTQRQFFLAGDRADRGDEPILFSTLLPTPTW